MYAQHFGLRTLPFENVPDPMFFFNDGDYAGVRSRITDALQAGHGLTVVTGPIGSGKTTLSNVIIADFPNRIKLVWMSEPPVNSIDLLLFVAQELGLEPSIPIKTTVERIFVIKFIRNALVRINSQGGKCLLIIDEAHLISDDIIHGIRLLNNLEERSTNLIQILLLGQEKLLDTIARPEMELFKQSIGTLEILGEMPTDRIGRYISHRIHVAGGTPSIIADTAWEALVEACSSAGIPRIINSLCDRSLNVAFKREKKTVDIDDVFEAVHEMGLQKEIDFYNLPVTWEHDLIKEQKTLSTDRGLSTESEETGREDTGIQSETSQSPEDASEHCLAISRSGQKGLKDHFKTFLRKILGKKNGTPAGIKEAVPSPGEEKAETTEEIGFTDRGDEKAAEKKEPVVKPDEWGGTDAQKLEAFEIPVVEPAEPSTAEKTVSSSEWLTIDSKGAKSFQPAHVGYKKPIEKKIPAAKPAEWMTMNAQKSEAFEIPVVEPAESLTAEKTTSSSEWVTIDSKGAKSFHKPAHVKYKKPTEKKIPAVKLDEWVRTSKKR